MHNLCISLGRAVRLARLVSAAVFVEDANMARKKGTRNKARPRTPGHTAKLGKQRLETYAILGEEGTGEVCINGAAAHLCKPGDLVIIATWAQMTPEEAKGFEATRIFLDPRNRIKEDVCAE